MKCKRNILIFIFMKKVLIISLISFFYFDSYSQLSTVTSGSGNNVTPDPIVVHAVGTVSGVYVGHGQITNTTTRPTSNGLLFTNTALGMNALSNSINLTNGSGNTCEYNTAIGYGVLENLYPLSLSVGGTYSMFNTGVGYLALNRTNQGNYNVALGSNSLVNNTQGSANVAIGYNSLSALTGSNVGGASSNNTAVGTNALLKNNGWDNTAIGCNAFGTTLSNIGHHNICIGSNTNVPDANANYQMNIGNFIYGVAIDRNAITPGLANGSLIISSTGMTLPPPQVGVSRPRLDVNGNIWIRTVSTGTNTSNQYLYVDANGEVKKATLPSGTYVSSTCNTGNFSNFLTKNTTTANQIACSQVYDNGAFVGIATITQVSTEKLNVDGKLRVGDVNTGGTSSNYLYRDGNGIISEGTLPNAGISNSCNIDMTFPITDGTSGNLQCSNMLQDLTTGCIGIGGASSYTFSPSSYVSSTINPGTSSFNYSLSVNGWAAGTGFISLSDKRFKKNIETIQSPLSKILNTNGYTYNWNKEFSKSKKLDDSKQIGFLAQDLAKVIPEAVVINGDGVYGVNYNAVTPVIVEAMKEQQKQIEELKEIVVALKAKLNGDIATTQVTLTENKLMQNTPNPFNSVTKIEYMVTADNNNYITISSLEGKPIKTVKLNNRGKGVVELNAGALTSGTYTYSLYANGILVDTKLMVISK